MPDGELLRRFVDGNGEGSFSELVRRHSGLIFSTALRRTGSWELAQEISQNVLSALARKAARLVSLNNLSPWLHRAAVLESAAFIRQETRYSQAMKRRQDDPTAATHPSPQPVVEMWDAVRPVVDEALNAMSNSDRELLLWHHGEGRTFQEIASLLGLSAGAAQRRGHRALEKLANRLRQRGVVVPVLALGGILTIGLTTDAGAAAVSIPALVAHAKTLSPAVGFSPAFSASAWMASPAMLVAAGLFSASLPVWWQVHKSPSLSVLETAAATGMRDPAAAKKVNPALGQNQTSRLSLLREAIERLKQTAPEDGPTKLGLQLRKYLLELPPEDLRAVAALLKGASREHREMLALLCAFSTRLAEVEPGIALELARPGGASAQPDFAGSMDRDSLVDVLTRQFLPDFLEAARSVPGLGLDSLMVWAGHDPHGACSFVENDLEAEVQREGYNKCLTAWLSKDPPGALLWLDHRISEKPDEIEKNYALIPQDLKYAVARQITISQFAELIPKLADPVVRGLVLESAYLTYSNDQPEAMALVAPFLRLEDHAKPVSVADVIWSWQRKDAAGAAEWVAGLPPGELKVTAARCLNPPDKK